MARTKPTSNALYVPALAAPAPAPALEASGEQLPAKPKLPPDAATAPERASAVKFGPAKLLTTKPNLVAETAARAGPAADYILTPIGMKSCCIF